MHTACNYVKEIKGFHGLSGLSKVFFVSEIILSGYFLYNTLGKLKKAAVKTQLWNWKDDSIENWTLNRTCSIPHLSVDKLLPQKSFLRSWSAL